MRTWLLAVSLFAFAAQGPQVFAPGSISDQNEQWRITFTPDGRTAYFAESEKFFPFTRKATIYTSTLADGAWSVPVVAPFSGVHSDIDPFVTPDGRRLYFSSIRPVNGAPRNDIDIWMVERTSQGWSDPIHLGPEVNSPDDELYPSASGDGTIYFASGPPAPSAGKHYDIFRARPTGKGFSAREVLSGAINTTPSAADPGPQSAWDFNPEVSADGTLLVFTSLRPGGHGLGDLYASRFVRGEWTPAQNLGTRVNTGADEYHPTLSRDQKQLFFVRRGPAAGDFYVLPTASVPVLSQGQ
jgi:Tol biopolymer transport system component